MKTKVLCVILWLIGFTATAQDIDTRAILRQIDILNTMSETYSMVVDMAYFNPGKDPETSSMKTYFNNPSTSLAVYTHPARDVGKKILLSGDTIWMYFPKVGRSIIMHPTGTLFGTVGVGDILAPPLLELYEFTDSRKVDGEDTLALTFSARTNNAPYGKIIYHYDLDDDTGRILYSECYTRSGILLKKAYFTEYKDLPRGGAYASRIRYQSAINPEIYVLMRFSDFKLENIPDYYFTPEGLKHVLE